MRRSGEAFRRNQEWLSEETAICACVRALPRSLPSRKRRQFEQAQFHCGKPPPAAAPRTAISIRGLQFRVYVGIDFAAKIHFFKSRGYPIHCFCSSKQFDQPHAEEVASSM